MYIRFAAEADLDEWRSRAERHARRALELEGTLAEAHEALAAVARHADFDWDRTIEQSVEALRLNASLDLPHFYLASAFQHIGRLDLVEREITAGLDANPVNLGEAFRLRGMAALWSGRFAEARTHFEQLQPLSSKPVSQTLLAQALYYTGDTARAEALLWGLQSSAPSEQRGRALLASFLAARGAKRDSLALVKDVLSRAYQDHHVAYSLGATYAGTRANGGGLPLDSPGGRQRSAMQRLVLERSTARSAANGPGLCAVHQWRQGEGRPDWCRVYPRALALIPAEEDFGVWTRGRPSQPKPSNRPR